MVEVDELKPEPESTPLRQWFSSLYRPLQPGRTHLSSRPTLTLILSLSPSLSAPLPQFLECDLATLLLKGARGAEARGTEVRSGGTGDAVALFSWPAGRSERGERQSVQAGRGEGHFSGRGGGEERKNK